MNTIEFKALVVEEKDGVFTREIKTKRIEELPEGDLLVQVHYSSLNYKDALSASGNKGVTKNYPHTPGIDAVGVVVDASEDSSFKINDEVIVTGFDLGMNTDGGFAQYIRVPSDWAIKLPSGLSMKEAMIIGTAGLTAGSSVLKLTEGVQPQDGRIVVSGATGGVGSMAVAILSKLGYSVSVITGKESEQEYLQKLGASEIFFRKNIEAMENRPIHKASFAGGIDTVGGTILENIIKSVKALGIVTCCGNVASPNLNLTVFPFILRGVSLVGIDSQNCPIPHREKVWRLLASEWKPKTLLDMVSEIGLEDLDEKINQILKGQLQGRTIVRLNS